MNKKAYAYITLMGISALALALGQPWSSLQQLTQDQVFALLVLASLISLSEWIAVDFSIGSKRTVRSSMAFLPLLTCAALFPAPQTILVAVAASLVTQLTLKDRAAWKVAINVALAVLSIGSAAIIYETVRGPKESAGIIDLVAFICLAISFFLVDTLLVTGFFTVRNEASFVAVFRQVVGPGAINAVYGLLASPIALFAAYLYEHIGTGGLILITLPLLLIRYSYISKIQLQQSNRDLLRVLIKTIETRDPYTSGHSLRVSRLARLIANDLGLSVKAAELVETAALLHDIGKIDSVYAAIIQKQAALTEEEHRVIKTHAIKGAELIKNLTSLPDEVIRGVRHHHERYDGRGYPDGLQGTSIPIAARIIMLCDSIDAMLSGRPYRAPMTVDQVRSEISRCAGTQFDPDIVAVVLRRNTLERAAAFIRDDSLWSAGLETLQGT